MRRLAVGHRQMPLSEHEPCFRAQQFDAQIRKTQAFPSHVPRLRRSRDSGPSWPAIHRAPLRRRKNVSCGRVPVAGHEGFEIVTVPGFLLGDDDMLDGGPRVIWGGRASLGVLRPARKSINGNPQRKTMQTDNLMRMGVSEILQRALVSHGGNATAHSYREAERRRGAAEP